MKKTKQTFDKNTLEFIKILATYDLDVVEKKMKNIIVENK